jgi:ribonuclease E
VPPAGRGERVARRPAAKKGDRVPVEAVIVDEPAVVDQATMDRRRGRERKGRPVGRYLMVVHVAPAATQIAVLEGKSLIEHYVSRPADDANEIDGNIYLGRVQNVLPGMEAAFVDIGTPKNAVLYRGDVRYDSDDLESSTEVAEKGKGKGQTKPTRGRLPGPARDARIEQLLKNGQMILCQVTKNPIGHKGARLTQEVSLPGRFVVLIPGSDTYGISKRLPDEERKRLRRILDEVRPEGHGLIVRTAAEGATADELRRDVLRLKGQWDRIDELAKRSQRPGLLYREPGVAVRVIREEFNRNYRGVIIDDHDLFEEVRDYVGSISPELADRIEYSGPEEDPLPIFERHHVHEQIHKALDRKVWLPSGGSLIIERTEALTVIDVNTGKNVGSSNLEETVFRNNLEAAEEIARQLRLRDIGGIIVIDFIDMEIAANRNQVIGTFREALARDKTRTQVFDISELGLVEMTRKRVSEGLVESFSEVCPTCGGRGIVIDETLF